MPWPRRSLLLAASVGIVFFFLLVRPGEQEAKANVPCDLGAAPIGAVTGAIGIGNPVGDACNAVTDGAVGAVTSPITGAIEGVGNSIFGGITEWVSGGAAWLIGQVARLSDETTTPELTTEGFIRQYKKMESIALFMAVAMLFFAVLESLGQGSGLLRVVFLNLPLALIGSSVAFVVVQMLVAATDGVSHIVAASTESETQHFFHGAIKGLGGAGEKAGEVAAGGTGGPVEATGKAAAKTAVPLFVTFLAAVIGAFAAFFVWIELLIRDAAVYVVALFAPLSLAASIWPRWSGVFRRSAEVLCVVIGSKFVIVAIIGLAAGLAADSGGSVEHVLAASALMLLACFSPFVLFKLVPFAEGAVASAYGRRSAAGGAIGGVQVASSAAMLRNSGQSHWAGKDQASGGGSGGATEGPRFSRSTGQGSGSSSKGEAGAEGGAGEAGAADTGAGAAAPVSAAAKAPVAAERGAREAGDRLSETGTAQAVGAAGDGGGSPPSGSSGTRAGGPANEGGSSPEGGAGGGQVDAGRQPESQPSPRRPQPPASGSEDDVGGEAKPPGTDPPRPKGGKSDEAEGGAK
jgi:hypothetical protein